MTFHHLLLATLALAAFSESQAMSRKVQKLPNDITKHLPPLKQSLREIKPIITRNDESQDQKDLANNYEILNKAYEDILVYQNTHRKWVKEMLYILAAGQLGDESCNIVAEIPYAPAHYALGILAFENNQPEQAWVHFKQALQISLEHPHERNTRLHAHFACALVESQLNKHTNASILYTQLFANLQEDERSIWEPKIQKELTRILDKIDVPWRQIPVMLVHPDTRKRNKALNLLLDVFCALDTQDVRKYERDLRDTLLLIRLLANKNLSSQAQLIMAAMYLKQFDKEKSVFDSNPIEPQRELDTALMYARSADVPGCTQAKQLRGEVAYEYGRFLERTQPQTDKSVRTRVREFYQESALCEFKPGIGRHAHACLEDGNVPLSDAQAEEYMRQLIRTSHGGVMSFQDLLSKIYFLGHTFGCGLIIPCNLKEAYVHADHSPASFEMQIIQATILMGGIEKQNLKQETSRWEIKPNCELAESLLESSMSLDEELTYTRLHEFYLLPHLPAQIKDSIFLFMGKRAQAKNPSLCAIRGFGALLLKAGDIQAGIELLESLGTKYKNPQGYCELCNAYICGDGVPQDFAKAMNYCIKALRFFDAKTLKSEAAIQTNNCLRMLISKLNSPELKENQQAQLCLKIITQAVQQYGITWQMEESKEQAVDSSEAH